ARARRGRFAHPRSRARPGSGLRAGACGEERGRADYRHARGGCAREQGPPRQSTAATMLDRTFIRVRGRGGPILLAPRAFPPPLLWAPVAMLQGARAVDGYLSRGVRSAARVGLIRCAQPSSEKTAAYAAVALCQSSVSGRTIAAATR